MKWEEFLDTDVEDWVLNRYNVEKTDIECPDCGRPLYMDKMTLLLSSPPQHHYWCVCGWDTTAPLRWEKETPKKEVPRDCDKCKHYIDYGNGRGCSKWQCEFEVKE